MNATAEKRTTEPQTLERPRSSMDDIMGSILQPDVLLSEQFFDAFRRKTSFEPEKRLLFAILEDAVSCLQHNYAATNGRNARLFQDAKEWIVQEGNNWVFSFDSVCEHLNLNPAYVRDGLLRWIDSKTASAGERHAWKRQKISQQTGRNGHELMAANF